MTKKKVTKTNAKVATKTNAKVATKTEEKAKQLATQKRNALADAAVDYVNAEIAVPGQCYAAALSLVLATFAILTKNGLDRMQTAAVMAMAKDTGIGKEGGNAEA